MYLGSGFEAMGQTEISKFAFVNVIFTLCKYAPIECYEVLCIRQTIVSKTMDPSEASWYGGVYKSSPLFP